MLDPFVSCLLLRCTFLRLQKQNKKKTKGRPYFTGKDAVYSPENESSPAPSSNEPPQMGSGGGGGSESRSKQSSRGNSFEIENLLKTAGEVIFFSFFNARIVVETPRL